MTDRPHPDGVDCLWLASDHEGHVAAFVTGGVGPIPILALNCEDVLVADLEELVCDLPRISVASLLISIKRPDDFLDLAERGVFVYDWTDVQRTSSESVFAYEPVAAPVTPIRVDKLPLTLVNIVNDLNFGKIKFADGQPIDVRFFFECREGLC